MIYGYIRVSSDKQTVENQRFEINNFCQRQNLAVDGWIEETISGTKAYSKRELGKLLKKVKKDDLIICAELSRLGRSLFMIMEILNICMSRECKVWTIKDNYRLGEDIQSKVLAFAFGLSAEIERNLISQRTREALTRLRAEGKTLGRPVGKLSGHMKLTGYEETIRTLLEKGLPVCKIAKILTVNRTTVFNYMKRYMGYEVDEESSRIHRLYGMRNHPRQPLPENFLDLYSQYRQKKITGFEAARQLGWPPTKFYTISRRYTVEHPEC